MDKEIRILIADDERYARQELTHLLSQYPFIQIAGEAETGEMAIIKTHQLKPDVVFLDVEMPKMTGMEAARSILELKEAPLIVFATAFPQFAVEAFRFNAVDYLLKPYDENELQQSVKRMKQHFFPNDEKDRTSTMKSSGKLAVAVDGEIFYLFPDDILYVYKDEKVTRIITKEDTFSVKLSLKELESRLLPFSFFRIHKSYLVNLQYVKRLTPWFNGAYQLELEGSEEQLSVSRNYVRELRNKLEL